ncbi:MAG: FGGY family carbohydrate kinase [Lentisphaeria bacterium]
MGYYLGLDASTQSISGTIINLETAEVVVEASVVFDTIPGYNCPNGVLPNDDQLINHANPLVWLDGLEKLLKDLTATGVDLGAVKAVSGSGQQHGTVYLNEKFLDASSWSADGGSLATMAKPMLSRETAPIWMDSSTSTECREIATRAGSDEEAQKRSGSPAIERFSGPQIRKFAKEAPEKYEQTAIIHLVSSFLASMLAGESVAIDTGDGAGMNLMNLQSCDWDTVLLEATAPDLQKKLPTIVASDTVVGKISSYMVDKYGFSPECKVIAWSGDNPNSLIGVGGYAPGTAVISLGTSYTYFAAMDEPRVDPNGYGHVFGNPAGGFMSLICFKNGALAQDEVRKKHGLSWSEFDAIFTHTPPGNNSNMMLPYFVPEITPLVLDSGVVKQGSKEFVNGEDRAAEIRAVIEGQALRLKLHSAWIGEETNKIRITGGASKSKPNCQTLADVFNARVELLESENAPGLGAAMRAAHAAGGGDWALLTDKFCRPAPEKKYDPIPDNVEIYKEMLSRYKEFAQPENV